MKEFICKECGQTFKTVKPACPYCPGDGGRPVSEFTKDELMATIRVLQDMNGELLVQIEDLNADLANRR